MSVGSGGRPNEGSYSIVEDSGGSDTEGLTDLEINHQRDTTILMLQRISDRLVAIETLQNQRAERIDTINYR